MQSGDNWLVREDALWLLLDEEEKLDLVRRLPPLLMRGRLEGMTGRGRGGGGGGTRDGYEYTLTRESRQLEQTWTYRMD